jgi:hypothetical protein
LRGLAEVGERFSGPLTCGLDDAALGAIAAVRAARSAISINRPEIGEFELVEHHFADGRPSSRAMLSGLGNWKDQLSGPVGAELGSSSSESQEQV